MPNTFSSYIGEKNLYKISFLTYFPVIVEGNSIKLFPSDHAIYYPLEIDLNGKFLGGTLNFFTEVLLKNYQSNNFLSPDKLKNKNFIQHKKSKALIVNLLDNCYGHSLIKLFNLYDAYQKFSSEYDIYAICHSALEHYIPIDKINIVSLNLTFSETQKCFDLNNVVLVPLRENYSVVDFFILDTFKKLPQKSELLNFFNFFSEEYQSAKPAISFHYRSDLFRSWGGKNQFKNIERLFGYLRQFFSNEVEFIITGDRDNFSFSSWVIDKRVSEFSLTTDFLYNNIYDRSIIHLGVHGSHMLIPSLLSTMCIHLTPPQKYKNMGDDILNFNTTSIISTLQNINLMSNKIFMKDIFPAELGFQLINVFMANIEKKYKHFIVQNINESSLVGQDDFLKKNYPYFHYEKAKMTRTKTLKKIESSVWKKYNVLRILGK